MTSMQTDRPTGIHVPAYKNSWQMTAISKDGVVTNRGVWNDEVTFFEKNNKQVLHREQHIFYEGSKSETIQIDEVERQTLLPISLKIYDKGEQPHTEIFYEGTRIFGKKIFNIPGLVKTQKKSMPFSYEVDEPIYDWHLWGILISGFSLRKDYKTQFLAHESYSYLPGDFRWYTMDVTGQEEIDAGKWGTVKCWIVEVMAEVKWKLWIAVDKTVAPVQQICINDLDNNELWWKPMPINKFK